MTGRAVVDGQSGFTLAELLVVIAVTGLIMAGLASLLISGQQSYLQGSNQVEAQQNARVAIEPMMQEVRGAGYNPTNATFDAVTAQSASGFTLQNDWNGNGGIEPGISVTVGGITRGEQVTYSLSGTTLRRQESVLDSAPQPIAQVQQLTLQYLDASGAVTTTAANIRTVVVTLQAEPDNQPAASPQGRVVVNVTDRARLRNRGN